MIMHIDMDAFFASIEQAVNPRLKGKALIVGSRGDKMRTVVCAASYEAKALGIDSGMPSREAFRICPSLEFVAAEQGKYIWTSRQILEILESYGFETNYVSIDEFQMDIASLKDPRALAVKIQKQIQDNFYITASIGIAKNCLLAKLASKLEKPKGLTVLTEENLTEILSKTPVSKFNGIGNVSTQVLRKLGVETCLDIYLKPSGFLAECFGQYGLNFYSSLHSTDYFDSKDRETEPKSVGHSYTLPKVSKNSQFIQGWLRLLSEMAALRLREKSLLSRTTHLWLNGPEIGIFGQQKTFTQATSDGYEIYQRCLKIVAQAGKKTAAIRALGVTCSNLSPEAYPAALLKEEKRREALIKAVDKINSRHGEGAIYPAIVTVTRKLD